MQKKEALKDFVIELLNKHLPPHYFYHNTAHTIYVYEQARALAGLEQCTELETDLIGAAALMHDSGFINNYNNHEEERCHLAKKYLPDFGYTENQINIICHMIMATKIPQSPITLAEKILADADLEYLGTELAATFANNLFRELNQINPSITEAVWNRRQIEFIGGHQYFTSTCRRTREAAKQQYLKLLTQLKK